MKILLPFILAFIILPLHAYAGDTEEIAKLTKKLILISKAGSGVDKPGQNLSEKFQKLDHTKVIDAMIPLLQNKKPGVSYLASYMILNCSSGVKPKHFEGLKKGWTTDGDWLPHAIAKIDTDESTHFLAMMFRENPQTQGQLDRALINLGEKAIPSLMKQFHLADPKKEPRFFSGLRFIFKGMQSNAQSAIPQLLYTAEMKSENPWLRKEAALSIGFIGEATEPYLTKLQKMEKSEPTVFGSAITDSIIASKTLLSATLVADSIDDDEKKYSMAVIARMGAKVRAIGPRVIAWLNHPDWDNRVEAVYTIGAIDYKKGAPELIKLLENKTDWRLAFTAAVALSKLESKEAIPHLTATAKNHWFPIVRKQAEKSILIINGKLKNSTDDQDWESMAVFVDRSQLSFPFEKLPQFGKVKKQSTTEQSVIELKKQNPTLLKKFLQTRNTTGGKMIFHISSHPFKSGSILGARAGEWCGSIQHVSDEGIHKILLLNDLNGIVDWNNETYVASGTSHMGMNEGILYRVASNEEGIALQPVFALPGCPWLMHVTEDGKLIVNSEGGLLVFTTLDQFKYYSEKPKEEPDNILPSLPESK